MNLDALREHKFDSSVVSYSDRDVMLYALSLGVCDDPPDENELPFVYEKDLQVLPSMTAVLAHPGGWIADEKFEAPILHGLYTYGICGFSILRNALEYDVTRLKSLDLRFSSPVMPGETLQVEGWKVDGGIAFQARVKERDRLAISNGFAGTI